MPSQGEGVAFSAPRDSPGRPLLAPWDRFAPLAAGKWRVVFAPHITKLSALALARFDPIYYVLDGRSGLGLGLVLGLGLA